MKKKIFIFLFGIFIFLFNSNNVLGAECNASTVHELAKIVFAETNDGSAFGKEDSFFIDIVTAGIVLNNSARFDGSTWQEKIYNLPDGVYYAHSSYRDTPFSTIARYYSSDRRGQVLYASALVLSGKFVLPKGLTGQSSCSCLLGTVPCRDIDGDKNAGSNCTTDYMPGNKEWAHFESVTNSAYDMYFGYNENIGLGATDTFGGRLISTTPIHYRQLADSFELNDYKKYDTEKVCELVTGSSIGGASGGSSSGTTNNNKKENSTIVDACTNPDILKVIYFAKLILNIAIIIIPIGLIVMGTIDFSKSVVTSDETVQKKNAILFVKRIVFAVLIFVVPWIVEVVITSLGNLADGVNFTDCLENANSDKIAELEEAIKNDSGNNNSSNKGNSNNDTKRKDTIIYVGDSRTEGMCNSVKMDDSEICIYKGSMGYDWLVCESYYDGSELGAYGRLIDALKEHPNSYVVINMGTNGVEDPFNPPRYADFYNTLADSYPNAQIVAVSVTPIDDNLAFRYGYFPRNQHVIEFNNLLKEGLNDKVIYCDVYSQIKDNFKTFDGIHYEPETYDVIHNKIKECLK